MGVEFHCHPFSPMTSLFCAFATSISSSLLDKSPEDMRCAFYNRSSSQLLPVSHSPLRHNTAVLSSNNHIQILRFLSQLHGLSTSSSLMTREESATLHPYWQSHLVYCFMRVLHHISHIELLLLSPFSVSCYRQHLMK